MLSGFESYCFALFLTATLNGASCIPRKHVCVPWYNYLQEFNQPVVHKQAKASRPVAVRSELAGTGIPDSTDMLSGFTRSPCHLLCFIFDLMLIIFLFNFLKVQILLLGQELEE